MKSAHLKGKGQRPQMNRPDGKKQSEGDAYFSYNMAILVGCQAEVTTRDGEKYEGVFVAYSPSMEIMLEAAHLVDVTFDEVSISKHYDLLVIPSEKIMALRFQNVDLHYATREFTTDANITCNRSLNAGDKELTPWDGADDAGEDLDLDTGTTQQNGWEAQEMFKKNEEKYGVVSSFNDDLSGYTTQLDKTDVESFKKHEEQAAQIASEIEKNTSSWERSKVENGDDEEEAFSAVVRPRSNANHTNNNNNAGNLGNDKYIPPSRRQQQTMQANITPMGQNHPLNNNGPSQLNNNNTTNRKPIYTQNQNPRANYAATTNNVYHHDRRNYDRRGPPQNQYGHPSNHGEGRRLDEGNRQPRMTGKVPMERGSGDRRGARDDPAKLKEFSTTFRLQTSSEVNQNRRLTPNQSQHVMSVHSNTMVGNNVNIQSPGGRNPSPPSNSNISISSTLPMKPKKEEITLPSLIQPSAPTLTASENTSLVSDTTSPHGTSNNSNCASTSVSPSTPLVNNEAVNETTPPSVAGSSESQTVSTGDCKGNGDSDSKSKKFTFNPNAKEFNPAAKIFTPVIQRSPSTPPRPPSAPAAASTPQLMTAPYHSIMPLPMPMLYAPPYTHAQAALTPSSNSSASSGGTTPRHGGHRKGGGMLGVPPRSDMTPPMQMATGPPLLAPASLQASAPPAQYAFVPPGPYSQVMRVLPQNIMPVYPSEGGSAGQMHPPMHYLHHNGATPQNNPGHPQNSTPPNNPNVATSVVPANGHGYGQGGGNHGGPHHMGFPYVSVPVVGVSYPHGPPHHIMTVPYVSHQGGGTTVLPQSQ